MAMLRRTVFTSSLRSHPLFIRHFIPSYQSLPFPTTAVIIAGRHYLRRLSTPTDTTIRCISSQTASDLVSKHPPFVRIYKDGRVERLAGTETIPASLTPQNGVVSKDAVYSLSITSPSVSSSLINPPNSPHVATSSRCLSTSTAELGSSAPLSPPFTTISSRRSSKPLIAWPYRFSTALRPKIQSRRRTRIRGGVVLFTRSLAHLKRQGIRINVLCPEFIQTDLAEAIGASFLQSIGGYMPMDMLIKGAFELITDESKAGACLWISNRRGLEYWPTPMEQAKYLVGSGSRKRTSFKVTSTIELPQSFEKIIVHALSHNFRNATRIVRTPLQLPIRPHQVLLKIIYAGVNASDVNFSSGRYFTGGSPKLPFDAGFEGVGLIAAVGESVKNLEVGTPAAVMTFGAYAEYMIVSSKHVLPVPRPDPEVVAMLTSGLTALTALEKSENIVLWDLQAGQMKSDETVLVTAAAGGTGQFAVQLAKLAGNKVIATCGGSEKAKLLKELGVLKKEFPKGVDIIYESVGGKMFDLCLNALAVYGRLIVIGMISQYQGEKGWQPSNYPGLCEKILAKSQTVAGFFLVQYSQLWKQNLDKLFNLYSLGKLKVVVCMDPTFEQTTSRL
ncbi:hypothetical protein Bca4012_092005 [Brassica carinata]